MSHADTITSVRTGADPASPVPGRFESAWRLVTLALVMLGFVALALTGELSPIAVAAFVVLWGIAVLRPARPVWWRDWMAVSLFALAALIVILYILRFEFVAILYSLVLLAISRCLTLRQPRDHVFAIALAFGMLLACTLITQSMSYMFFMFGFVTLTMLDLACYTLALEAIQTEREATAPVESQPERALFWRLVPAHLAIAAIALVIAQCLFFVMPHYATQQGGAGLGRSSGGVQPATTASSGFSDSLDLGSLSRISLDNTVVMNISAAWEGPSPEPVPSYLRLRGANLSVFEEGGWSPLPVPQQLRSSTWQTVNMPSPVAARGPVFVQDIRQKPDLVHRAFGGGLPFQFQFDPGTTLNLNWANATIDILAPLAPPWTHYKVRSIPMPDGVVAFGRLRRALADLPPAQRAAPLGAKALSAARLAIPTLPPVDPALVMSPGDRATYTALPQSALIPRLRPVADEHAAGETTADRVLGLQRWFHTNFEYSLEPETPKGMHPLESFLLNTHRGHCEYFASAMVVLLRIQHVPSRVVTGYYTTEFNSEVNQFVVRQSDAHAWCEVWIDGWGWLVVDPTPPSLRGRASLASYQPPLSKRIAGALRAGWQKYIYDYTNTDKTMLLATILKRPWRENLALAKAWLNRVLVNHLSDQSLAGGALAGAGDTSLVPFVRSFVSILLLVLLWLVYRRALHLRQASEAPGSPVAFMNHLLDQLERLGWRRAPGQTPAELLDQVDRQTAGRWPLQRILELYHHLRYANATASDEDLAWVQRTIRSIHK